MEGRVKLDFPDDSKWGGFLSLVKEFSHIYIQTHDFPDHDAVASAYALQRLLEHYLVPATIIYQGNIQRDNLRSFVDYLGIRLFEQNECDLGHSDKIVIVDGCKGNKNVTDLAGDEIAVIDHHEVANPDVVPWSDIRTELGACCTLVFTYWEESGASIPRDVGTALLVGLLVDSAMMTRGLSREDVVAYSRLYGIADMQYVNKLLRNNIQKKDLKYFADAIKLIHIRDAVGFCYLEEGCNQNLLGILGDFFLAIREIDLVLLCAENGQMINLSMRSERDEWNASTIIQKVLDGTGFGGGHRDMAGGIIYDKSKAGPRLLEQRLYDACL